MATRQKTVEFAFPALASLTDNTLTTLTQITVYLPESGKVFKSVVALMSADGIETAAGNVTSRTLGCRLGAAGYTNNANANLFTGTGEQLSIQHAVDLTAHFTANWTTQTSQTMDCQVLIDGTGTGAGWTNVCVTLYITYDYDDTSVTQIKTVRIPLNCPVGAVGTTKPGSPNTTLPLLNTALPETSKTFRNSFITLQGNINAAATTDSTLSMQLDTSTARTTGNHENGLNTDRWIRYVWETNAVLDTATAMGFYMWGSVARYNHFQAWLTVTYEFDATASTECFNSLVLPLEIMGPMGGTTTADAQRGTADFFIQEPTTISTVRLAAYLFWDQIAAIGGLNMRLGTGSYVTYTDAAAVVGGSNGCMIRNDTAATLTRGANTISCDIYRTDTADLGFGLTGFVIVNYTSGKPTQGYGAANRTIRHNLGAVFSGAAAIQQSLAAKAIDLPTGSYHICNAGPELIYLQNNTTGQAGVEVVMEQTTGEGGLDWYKILGIATHNDAETSPRMYYGRCGRYLKRFPNDPGVTPFGTRMDIETARRWNLFYGGNGGGFSYLDMLVTLHNIDYTVTGTVSGSAGGTVNLTLHRASDGEKLATTTRSGNGAYSFTWYDNTEDVFIEAVEGTTYLGRSGNGKAA